MRILSHTLFASLLSVLVLSGCAKDEPTDLDNDGFTTEEGDCDDNSATVYPGAPDNYGDGSDQNCDGTDGVDADEDGWASQVSGGEDCDDGDSSVSPGASDIFGDAMDQNCDGVDGVDADGDGSASKTSGGDDCNDSDAAVSPFAEDNVGNGVDDNCDGVDGVDSDADGWASIDSGGTDCNDNNTEFFPGSPDPFGDGADQNCDGIDGIDADGDGWASSDGGGEDCDDLDAATYPGAGDTHGDNKDQNCDGTDGVDADGDGWASEASGGKDCDDNDALLELADVDADGYSTCDGDCDDADSTAFLGAASQEPSLCTHDIDGDGYGDEFAASPLDAGTDCDDTDAALESADVDLDGYSTCDGDCDDTDADLELADADGDGYSTCDGDCDDTDSSLIAVCEAEVFIGFTELDGLSSQCSNVTNESMYNACNGTDFGFTWTDTTGVTPSAITVELNRGISCDSGSSSTKSTTLNSVGSGSHTWTDDGQSSSCQCNPTTDLLSWTLSDVSGFTPNGSNSFSISDNANCEGLTLYNGWSTSAYARVVLTY